MSTPPRYTLAHPIYLDVPMMISFLAALEGGVSVSGSETSTETGSRERTLAARAGLRAKLFSFGDAEASGEAANVKREEETLVSQTERHHTAASLFNVLYGYLSEDQQIVNLEHEGDLEDLQPGEIVQFSGDFKGNPLEDILAFASALFPYFVETESVQQGVPNPRSGNPAKRAASGSAQSSQNTKQPNEGLRIVQTMADDLRSAPVHDLLFSTHSGLQVVVTAASDFYSVASAEHLREGTFGVVGKVTRVYDSEGSINLTRRTVMGAAGPELARTTIEGFRKSGALAFSVADPIVEGPTVQIIPMAIFV